MRILFLTSRLPYPPIGGDKLRVFHFIKGLSRNHQITLLSLTQEKPRKDQVAGLERYLEECETVRLPKAQSYFNCLVGLLSHKPLQIHYYASRAMEQQIKAKLGQRKYDLVFVHLIRMAEYIHHVNGVPKILDLTDALSLNYQRIEKHLREYHTDVFSLSQRVERKRVLRYELDVISRFDRNLIISAVDRDYLGAFTDTRNVEIVAAGVDLNYFQFHPGPYSKSKIVFVGNMRTFPNADAVIYFAKKIWPLVLKDFPSMQLYIVGTEPAQGVRKLSREKNIVVTGEVKDVRPFLREAVLSICPMRTGAGAKNKVLEAMAVGTPVVSTSLGVEGIEAVAGRDVLIADTPAEFAQEIRALVENPHLRERQARNARKLVEERYSWETVLDKLNRIVEGCVGNGFIES